MRWLRAFAKAFAAEAAEAPRLDWLIVGLAVGLLWGSCSAKGQTLMVAPAPGLTAGDGTCEGSMTGGAATGLFGLSFGFTREREACNRRADARTLAALGDREAALEVLCGSERVREGRRQVGRPCRRDMPRGAAQAPQDATGAPQGYPGTGEGPQGPQYLSQRQETAPRAGALAVQPIDVCGTLSSPTERRAYAGVCGRAKR